MKNKEIVFLTVGTDEQKYLCEKIIANNQSDYDAEIIVVSDNDFGCRLGSGGAVLNLISKYYNPGVKIAIINSGGMSKRSINYAVKGKAFANLELEEKTVTLFELIFTNTRKLMSCYESGTLICCSDILIDAEKVSTDFSTNIGFCIKADVETASRHGVMFHNAENTLVEFAHKCDEETLLKICDNYNTHEFLVDTGAIYFTDELCAVLCKAVKDYNIIEKLSNDKTELNLYSEIVPLLAEKFDEQSYLQANDISENCQKIRQILFDLISGHSLRVYTLGNQSFFHFGSLKEALKNIIELSGKKDGYVSINSHLKNATVGTGTVLDNVILKTGCKIGNNCLVSDITLDEKTEIDDEKAVCGIKLLDGSFVAIICDIDENPKKMVNSTELWETERFYKGTSFGESLEKYRKKSTEKKYSLQYCVENADVQYLHTHSQYISELNSCETNQEYLEIREKILKTYFDKKELISEIKCIQDKVVVNLPLRINMSGTWTDAMPYCIDNGGQVVNMAITVDGKLPITVSVEKLPEKRIEFCSDGIRTEFSFNDSEALESEMSDFILHIAALKAVGITKNTIISDGFRLTTSVSDIDKGSGLGTSSILLSGCIKALGDMFGKEYSTSQVLEAVFVAEQIMGTGGGWQDQVGGFLPSIKVGTTVAGIEQKLDVEYITMPKGLTELFNERLVIIPTGQRHFGRFIVSDVADRYLSGQKDSIEGHKNIRRLNSDLINSITNDNYSDFCACINKHFDLLKNISPLVSNNKIDKLVTDCLHNVADAVSVCGAGGGGYLFAVLKEGCSVEKTQKFLAENYPYIKSPVKKIQLLHKI